MEATHDKTIDPGKPRAVRRWVRRVLWPVLFLLVMLVGIGAYLQSSAGARFHLPLILAVERYRTADVASLLKQGADPNTREIYEGSLSERLSQLLGGGGGHVATDYETVLIAAARRNQVDVVRLLLEHGAAVDLKYGRTEQLAALNVAAGAGAIESMKLLIAHGADVNAADAKGMTPLFGAVFADFQNEQKYGRLKGESCVALLLAHGANVNVRAKGGETPLLTDAGARSHAALSLLLSRGADVNAHDDQGLTALMRAIRSRDPEAARQLLDHGARVNDQEAQGKTALQMAVEHFSAVPQAPSTGVPLGLKEREGDLVMVRLLLGRGADPGLKDKTGKSILQRMEALQDSSLITLLNNAVKKRR